MHPVLAFASKMAVGLMLAVGLAFVIVAMASSNGAAPARAGIVDYFSLSIGLAIGIGLGAVGRITWSQLPRLLLNWLFANERNFYRIAMAVGFLAVLLWW